MTTLNKAFPKWYTGPAGDGGIFKALAADYLSELPWLSNYTDLDLEYFGNHSGNKIVAPLIDHFIEANRDAGLTNPEQLTAAQISAVKSIIYNKYKIKWDKLYNLLSLQYNPIQNYDMTQEETPDVTHRHSVTNDYEVTDVHTRNVDISRSETPSNDFEVTETRSRNVDISTTETPSQDYEVSNTRTRNIDISRTETPSNDYEVSDEKTTKTNLTVTTEPDTTATIYAFNSSEPVPSNGVTGQTTVTTEGEPNNNVESTTHTQTGSMTTRETGDAADNVEIETHTQTGSMTTRETGDAADNVETATRTQTGSMTVRETGDANDNVDTATHTQTGATIDTETGTRTLTRSGNIGVTTSQQMIQSEIELWQWNFFEQIYVDVDTILTIQIYK